MSDCENVVRENKIQIPRRRPVSNGSVCPENFGEHYDPRGKEIVAKLQWRAKKTMKRRYSLTAKLRHLNFAVVTSVEMTN